jgi:hypothetical protein
LLASANHSLVKDGWCGGYGTGRAREGRKGLWAEPPWEWRKKKEREWADLFLGVGALGVSLRRSQRDSNGGTGLNKSGSVCEYATHGPSVLRKALTYESSPGRQALAHLDGSLQSRINGNP